MTLKTVTKSGAPWLRPQIRKHVPRSITLERDLDRRAGAAAKERGVPFSVFVADAIRAFLGEEVA